MTPKERVFKRIKGEKVDKIPNASIVMGLAARLIDVPYSKYVQDYKYLVEGNIKICEKFGIDFVSTISDPMRETSDFGADVVFPHDGVPYCKQTLISEYSDISKLHVSDPMSCARMTDRILAVDAFKNQVGNIYPIIGWVEGAFAEAADLRGLNNLLTDMYDEEDFVYELLSICVKQAELFAVSQIQAGADIIGIGDAAVSLIGPENYKKFAFNHQKKLIDVIHSYGAMVKLHICGDITDLLHIIAETGADIVDIDHMVDFKTASEVLADMTVSGNFDPVSILLQGTPQGVWSSVKDCVAVSNNRCFITAGCEIPANTPDENMVALNSALKDILH